MGSDELILKPPTLSKENDKSVNIVDTFPDDSLTVNLHTADDATLTIEDEERVSEQQNELEKKRINVQLYIL